MQAPPRISNLRRWTYFGTGWVFFGLGVLGAFVPVLPTTPLMLIALWAFSQSSERFQIWLYNHRIFGPPLQRWLKFRVISIPAKVTAVGAMAVSLSYLVFFTATPLPVLLISGGLMLFGIWFIVTKPSEVPAKQDESSQGP